MVQLHRPLILSCLALLGITETTPEVLRGLAGIAEDEGVTVSRYCQEWVFRVVLAMRVIQATQECCGPCGWFRQHKSVAGHAGLSRNNGVAANRYFRLVRAKPEETQI